MAVSKLGQSPEAPKAFGVPQLVSLRRKTCVKIEGKCKNTDKIEIFALFQSVYLHNPRLLKEAMTMAKLEHCHEASKAVGTLSLAALRRKKIKTYRKNAKNRFYQWVSNSFNVSPKTEILDLAPIAAEHGAKTSN